jgi:hypothetical protein
MTLVRHRTKLLTQWRSRYPTAFRIYRAISWTFNHSPLVSTVKRLLARPRLRLAKAANDICPTWIGPRCWLAHHYAAHGEFRNATIADDVLARSPDLDERDRSIFLRSTLCRGITIELVKLWN